MSDLDLGAPLSIGSEIVPGRVWIAPMTGVSDLPFRQAASRLGAAYVATEMVACADFLLSRPEAVRRAAVGETLPLMVIQLVGHEAAMLAAAARLAAEAGARIIDLNFGCPAKAVTGRLCGSALMREADLAEALVRAAVEAAGVPVTVKMRLGWDERSRNAAEFAVRAEAAGAAAVTVHARTRCQFYAGVAEWAAVAEVKAAVGIPVLINGDITDGPSARAALSASGADGIMIGRGATGRPWLAAALQAELAGRPIPDPGRSQRYAIVREHLAAGVRFHGPRLGPRLFRKHLAAYIEAAPWPACPETRRAARADLCRIDEEGEIATALAALWCPPSASPGRVRETLVGSLPHEGPDVRCWRSPPASHAPANAAWPRRAVRRGPRVRSRPSSCQ